MTNGNSMGEAFNQACADMANAAARLRELGSVAVHFTGPKKLTIAVLRKTIREASLVCAALERMGHEAHPFGWSDPEKNASVTMLYDVLDADSVSAVIVKRERLLFEIRSHLRDYAVSVTEASVAEAPEIAPIDEVASEAKCSDHLDPWPDDEPLTPAIAARLLHDDFALTLEEQTCILDALGCIDRQVNGRGHERAQRDSVETILAHIGELQHDAIRWQELQRAKAEPETSDPAVVLGAVGEAGSFVVEDPKPQSKTVQAGDTVRIKGSSHSDDRVFAVGRVENTGNGLEALLVWNDGMDGVGTKVVPVAALEVVGTRIEPTPSEPESENKSEGEDECEDVDVGSMIGRTVRLRGAVGGQGRHVIAARSQHTEVDGVWCEAVVVASETPNGIVTSLVPVAALEVV